MRIIFLNYSHKALMNDTLKKTTTCSNILRQGFAHQELRGMIKFRRRLSICVLTAALGFHFNYDTIAAGLRSGPMLGYGTMSEVLIWTQTDASATVEIEYWNSASPNERKRTVPVVTRRADAFVAKSRASALEAGTTYHYRVLVDGRAKAPQYRDGYRQTGPIPLQFTTPRKWRFTEKGHLPFDFRVALGSCSYINEYRYDRQQGSPYGDGYAIFESIYETTPDLMIWLGDSVYLREPDWLSVSGIHHRWSHDRSLPQLRALLASAFHYAIWDDHDYGPNNAGHEFWNKRSTTEAFTLFWGNPSAGLPETPGVFTFFNWGDVNFYLLDNRTYRTNPAVHPEAFGRPRHYLGERQLDWLIDSLVYRQSQSRHRSSSLPVSFNIICVGGQVLSDSGNPTAWRSYEEEWQLMIDRIMDAGIDGVIFLSGDIHASELNRETRNGGGRPGVSGHTGIEGASYIFHEITSSPLTAGPSSRTYPNSNRVDILPETEEEQIRQRSFVTLDFFGPFDDRRMEIRYYDTYGNLLNQRPESRPGEVIPECVLRAQFLKAPSVRSDK